jgi:DNA-binding ferritin-like protein
LDFAGVGSSALDVSEFGIVAKVNAAESPAPIAALNRVLSEVIDVVQDVKQAEWRVPGTRDLHAVLADLFDDLKGWALLLMDEDVALGGSPLTSMPSVAGRKPLNLWTGFATEEDVRRIVGEHLDQLGQHVRALLADLEDGSVRTTLASVEQGLLAHRQVLSEP